MDIKNIETFILTGRLLTSRLSDANNFFYDPIKTRLLRSGMWLYILAVSILVMAIAILNVADVPLLYPISPSLNRANIISVMFLLSLVLIPILIRLSIQKSAFHIADTAKYTRRYSKEYMSRSRFWAVLSMLVFPPILGALPIPPEAGLFLWPIFCLALWSKCIYSAGVRFYKIYLIEKYCPYLVTFADAQHYKPEESAK